MMKLQRVLLAAVFATAFCGMGCDEDVCSDWDLEQCYDDYDDCLDDLNISVSDAGVDLEENCAIEYCQCLDNEGCDWSAVPVCEE